MNALASLLAAMYGRDFGQGKSHLSNVENALVLFMLGLIVGVIIMTAFFVFLSWRQSQKENLPEETHDLLDDLEQESWKQEEESQPSSAPKKRPRVEEDPLRPWERDADWWRGDS